MFSNLDLQQLIFGRLTLEAIPYHEPILLVTFAVVAVVGLALAGRRHLVRQWGYLWQEWFTSVDHKKIGIMYVILAIVMLLRGFADAIMMITQKALSVGAAEGYLPPHHYDQVFTAHGTIMIFFMAMPFVTGGHELRHAAADRRPRRGLPVPEQFQLLDDGQRRGAHDDVPVRRGVLPGHLARLSAAVGGRLLSRCRGRLLHLGPSDRGRRDDFVRHQPDRHHRQDARPGHDA